jgi:hypothetical protein
MSDLESFESVEASGYTPNPYGTPKSTLNRGNSLGSGLGGVPHSSSGFDHSADFSGIVHRLNALTDYVSEVGLIVKNMRDKEDSKSDASAKPPVLVHFKFPGMGDFTCNYDDVVIEDHFIVLINSDTVKSRYLPESSSARIINLSIQRGEESLYCKCVFLGFYWVYGGFESTLLVRMDKNDTPEMKEFENAREERGN